MTKYPRRLAIIALLIVAVSGGGWWWWSQGRKAGDLLVLQGNVEVRQVNLGFKVAGRIKQIFVDEGDTVVEGQTLASLDKVYLRKALPKCGPNASSQRPVSPRWKPATGRRKLLRSKRSLPSARR